ncbi:MAG: zinc ribbon domain-containing protein [Oscillospiraceae bacterium]
MITCPNCGASINEDAAFCHECGAPLSSAAPRVASPAISEIYRKCFALLKSGSTLLWGLSLLNSLLCVLAVVLGVLPIISIPIVLTLNLGMTSIYLNAYLRAPISSAQLFVGFKHFLHFCGGMAWMALWIFIWALIPIVGIVFAVMKFYSYRFVPYILLADPNISAGDALRLSMEQTRGFCGRMFGGDIIIKLCIFAIWLLLLLFGMLPYIGILFRVISFAFDISVVAFAPLIFGVISAAFYREISAKNNP